MNGLAKLTKRLISIKGPDSATFLNGLATTRFLPNIIKKNRHTISDSDMRHQHLGDIINLSQNWGIMHEDLYDPNKEILIRRDGVFSMFLNGKGRVVSDCFIYPNPFYKNDCITNEPSYLIEVEESSLALMNFKFNMYKLQSKITLETTDYYSYYYYNDTPEFDEFLDTVQSEYFNTYDPLKALQSSQKLLEDEAIVSSKFSNNLVGLGIDNRIPNFGIKLISDIPISQGFFSDSFRANFPVDTVDKETITTRRILNGLYESSDSPPNYQLLPFDMNLDYINGLSLDKGCYTGQELTSRTYNSSAIRKRIFPVQFFEITNDILETIDQVEDIVFNPQDPIIDILSKINISNIDKLEVSPLIEEQPEPTTETSSPFAASPFSGKPSKRRKQTVGKVLSIKDNLGFMLLNLKDAEKKYFKFELPDLDTKHIGIKVSKPDWWPEDE